MRMILFETLITSNTFSHHFSASRIPTPQVPSFFPQPKYLYRESLPAISLRLLLERVSWKQHRSTPLLNMVSTTSEALSLIEPTFKDPTRKELSLTLWQFFLKDVLPFDHSFRFFFFSLAGPAIIFETLNLVIDIFIQPIIIIYITPNV